MSAVNRRWMEPYWRSTGTSHLVAGDNPVALCGFEPTGIMRPGKNGRVHWSPPHPGTPLFPCKRCSKRAARE